jgi:hypothetical protein
VDQPVHLPSFNEGVKFSQKVFRLGRDNSLKLRITYGRAAYFNPDMYERYHNMYFDCAYHDSDRDEDDDDDDDDNEVTGLIMRFMRIFYSSKFFTLCILMFYLAIFCQCILSYCKISLFNMNSSSMTMEG